MKAKKGRTEMVMEAFGVDSDTIRRQEQERKKRIADLEAKSKKLYELIVSENFTVEEAFGTSHATSIMPMSEQRIGGSASVYSGGYCSKLTLRVSPDSPDIPVRTLSFDGFSIVKAGDHISARIPRYEEKKVEPNFPSIRDPEGERVFYFDRGYKSGESAIEIAILSQDGKVLRTDKAVSYTDLVVKSMR